MDKMKFSVSGFVLLVFCIYVLDKCSSSTNSERIFDNSIGVEELSIMPFASKKSSWELYKSEMKAFAKRVDADYSKLMWISYFETRHGQIQVAKCGNGFVKGVWQWTDSNRKEFNIPENVHQLPLHQQVPYIEVYWKSIVAYTGKPNDNYCDYALVNFYPKAVNKPMSYKMNDAAYRNNTIIDTKFGNNNGILEKCDYCEMVEKKIRQNVR